MWLIKLPNVMQVDVWGRDGLPQRLHIQHIGFTACIIAAVLLLFRLTKREVVQPWSSQVTKRHLHSYLAQL